MPGTTTTEAVNEVVNHMWLIGLFVMGLCIATLVSAAVSTKAISKSDISSPVRTRGEGVTWGGGLYPL